MDIVYTPWRLQYVQAAPPTGSCIFCDAADAEPCFDNLVLARSDDLLVMLNRFPYTNGHMLVVPRPHVDSLSGLQDRHRRASLEALTRCEGLLRELFCAQGVNVGLNLGRAAGAGIADHLHWHILPRWAGDTNFSTVVGQLRVIPEDLRTSYERLRSALGAEPL